MCIFKQFSNNKLTIIIPTKDRAYYIERLLKYVSDKKDLERFNFIIADSSRNANLEVDTKINYVPFEEHLNPFIKIKECIDLVHTEYVMILGDDDFYISEELVDVTQSGFDICQGNTVSFWESNKNKISMHYNKKYRCSMTSIVNIDLMQKAFRYVRDINSNVENESLIVNFLNKQSKRILETDNIVWLRQVHKSQTSNKDKPSNKTLIDSTSILIKKYIPIDLQIKYYGLQEQSSQIKEILEYI